MKNFLLFLILMVSSIACQKDDSIGPPELLYQRWAEFQTKRIGDNAWSSRDMDAQYDVEYKRDGSMIYRRNGQLIGGNCCAPVQYSRTNGEIQYTKWDVCPYAYCNFRRTDTITQLDNDLLELNDGYRIRQYRAVK